MKERLKIIVIVGPTASGKSSLAVELAKYFSGEVISADSRQVYRGLDIGTGKMTEEEMRGVPHHLLDIADPKEQYTVADFVRDGRSAVEDILSRGKLPILVGGTFFYIDALLGKVVAPDVPPNDALRKKLETLSNEELYSLLSEKDAARAQNIDRHNPRRLIRALEIVEAKGSVPGPASEELYDTLILGISVPKETLHKNIHERLLARMDAGMIEEVERLQREGLSPERLDAFGLEYRYVSKYLHGELTKEEMLRILETKIRQFAKRQMTWLKRDKDIVWVHKDEVEEIHKKVEGFLG